MKIKTKNKHAAKDLKLHAATLTRELYHGSVIIFIDTVRFMKKDKNFIVFVNPDDQFIEGETFGKSEHVMDMIVAANFDRGVLGFMGFNGYHKGQDYGVFLNYLMEILDRLYKNDQVVLY